MPLMPRFDKKATKIAYAILGTPPNLRKGNKGKKYLKAYNPNELYLGPQDKNQFIT